MIRSALLAVTLLAGCAGYVAPDPVRLPRDSVEGAGDPTRAAISRSAYAFANQAALAGRPSEMARAIADMEFLAAALPFDPRYQQRDPLLPWQLAQARAEWRAAGVVGRVGSSSATAARCALRVSDECIYQVPTLSPLFSRYSWRVVTPVLFSYRFCFLQSD